MTTFPSSFREYEHWQRFSDQGIPAHFYHANGFPLGVYKPLLDSLSQRFALHGLKNRATWQGIGEPGRGINWATYADDLIQYLEQHRSEPVVGIGHSMGAIATLIAAQRRPDLFRALVLIEPSMLKPSQAVAVNMLPMTLKRHIEPIRSALRKTRQWESFQAFQENYQQKRAFSRFEADHLDVLLRHVVVPSGEGGVKLGFPATWEAWNYAHALNVMPIAAKVKLPTVVIRGKPSVFFSEQMWRKWQRLAPDGVFLENTDYGHLLPMEAPDICFELIEQGLEQLNL